MRLRNLVLQAPQRLVASLHVSALCRQTLHKSSLQTLPLPNLTISRPHCRPGRLFQSNLTISRPNCHPGRSATQYPFTQWPRILMHANYQFPKYSLNSLKTPYNHPLANPASYTFCARSESNTVFPTYVHSFTLT